ncbi:uncharacterized protein BDZ99DRAFT_436473 [Mytilinidion resinicola]|uniref:Vacuolar protein sorting-associated protein 51 homolog n=1 Tax=Mytilinidion resinicola TaxID=574789 RepID=A0A6A6YZM4_9PEZI|nr:uncharacterized protein BDZ99DRAFT_436473 [Mytilinidion resinicola]KAF2813893.1 hypothetical protein BDZ99DRAFT_436473 [Mytilinidion resinicola]
MSTIASPRASTSIRSPSSSRTSLEGPSGRPAAPGTTRRNRAALRDYYGLKGTQPPSSPDPSSRTPLAPEEPEDDGISELDKDGFDAPGYVNGILSKQGLSGVLRVESDLVSQIRNLDGERKSLVYDNYSKLIAATDTIRKMRTNMDPLAPTTSTLSPAISHIAEIAAVLSKDMQDRTPSAPSITLVKEGGEGKQGARETVRWVLDAPRRLRELVDEGKEEEADKEWEVVSAVLEKWRGVKGVKEVGMECEAIILNEET